MGMEVPIFEPHPILKNDVFFEDKQMMIQSLFDISSTGFRFQKNLKILPIQFLNHTCPRTSRTLSVYFFYLDWMSSHSISI